MATNEELFDWCPLVAWDLRPIPQSNGHVRPDEPTPETGIFNRELWERIKEERGIAE